jgi:hypothetical protein
MELSRSTKFFYFSIVTLFLLFFAGACGTRDIAVFPTLPSAGNKPTATSTPSTTATNLGGNTSTPTTTSTPSKTPSTTSTASPTAAQTPGRASYYFSDCSSTFPCTGGPGFPGCTSEIAPGGGGGNSPVQYIVALGTTEYAGGANCNRCIQVTNTATGQSVTATVMDFCAGCDSFVPPHIDLSPSAAYALDPTYQTDGIFNITWQYVSCPASPTATKTPLFTFTSTNSPTSTATATDTPLFSFTPTNSPISTSTATPTGTPTATSNPLFSYTPTNSPTSTASPTNTWTSTSTPTSTNTPSFTSTTTSTGTPTNTPLFSFTPTSSSTTTRTWTVTSTFTNTSTNTFTSTNTWTSTRTPTFTNTASFTGTSTSTGTSTNTPAAMSPTTTPTVTSTATQPVVSLSIGPNPPANQTVAWGASNVPILQLDVTNTSGEAVNLTSLTVTGTGTGNLATGIVEVQIYLDNGSGIPTGSPLATVLNPFISGNTVTINFSGTVGAGVSQNYLVTYYYATTPSAGTYGASVANSASLTGQGQTSGQNIKVTNAPVNGATDTILPAPTATYSFTLTNTNTPTFTATNTFTPTNTFTTTPTFTGTITNTPLLSYTPTLSPTITNTPLNTGTFTPTSSIVLTPYTYTPTNTFTYTPTPLLSYTPSGTPTVTNSPTVTATPTAFLYEDFDNSESSPNGNCWAENSPAPSYMDDSFNSINAAVTLMINTTASYVHTGTHSEQAAVTFSATGGQAALGISSEYAPTGCGGNLTIPASYTDANATLTYWIYPITQDGAPMTFVSVMRVNSTYSYYQDGTGSDVQLSVPSGQWSQVTLPLLSSDWSPALPANSTAWSVTYIETWMLYASGPVPYGATIYMDDYYFNP